jgi:hypothetical protein
VRSISLSLAACIAVDSESRGAAATLKCSSAVLIDGGETTRSAERETLVASRTMLISENSYVLPVAHTMT